MSGAPAPAVHPDRPHHRGRARTPTCSSPRIIPLANAGQEAAARTFNAAIPGIVQSKVNAGKRVHLVDMHGALTTADLIDGIHPTAGGYDKMAAAWYAALQSVSGSIGQPGGTSPTPTPLARERIRGVGSGQMPGRRRRLADQRRAGADLGLQRQHQPAVDADQRPVSCGSTATSAWT